MRLVVLFGGQGSQGLISSHLAEGTDAATALSSSAAILLSKCHAAFLEELLELNAGGGPYPGLDASHFRAAKDLVSPRPQYHTHGILQSSLICLHQLLHYLAGVERNGTLESAYSQLIETAGLCSGMVPAIVVAASANEEQFMRFGVGAFRLAFWVGWRATIEAQKVATASDKDHAWSLVVSGLSRTQVEKHMEKYYSTVRPPIDAYLANRLVLPPTCPYISRCGIQHLHLWPAARAGNCESSTELFHHHPRMGARLVPWRP